MGNSDFPIMPAKIRKRERERPTKSEVALRTGATMVATALGPLLHFPAESTTV